MYIYIYTVKLGSNCDFRNFNDSEIHSTRLINFSIEVKLKQQPRFVPYTSIFYLFSGLIFDPVTDPARLLII